MSKDPSSSLRPRIILFAVALAGAVILSAHYFGGEHQLEIFALLLALTACVYGGAALTPAGKQYGAVELPFVILIFAAAVAGLVHSPLWIAAGYLAHAGWDLLHHIRTIRTPVIRPFPPICAIFDGIVGLFVLGWWMWFA